MYNFKRDAKVYFHVDGVLYPVDVYPDLSFSQTYKEDSYNRKTLHNQLALNKGATIVEANVANFSFTIPIKFDNSVLPLSSLFEPDYATGTIEPMDIYVELTNKKFKLTKAAIETTTFNITKTEVLTASVSGTASLLSEVVSLPTTPTTPNTDPYTIVRGVKVQVNSVTIPSVAAISLEINNSIEWSGNTTLHKSLSGELSYKDKYVLQERRVSGSVTEFLLDSSSGTDYSTTASIIVEILSSVGQSPPMLTFTLPETVYTRRVNMDELVTRVYDFRLTNNNVVIIPTLRS